MSFEIDADEALAYVLCIMAGKGIFENKTLEAFIDDHRMRGSKGVAGVWRDKGTAIAERYNASEPVAILELAEKEFFSALDDDAESSSGLKFALTCLLNADSRPFRAVNVAYACIDAYLTGVVERENAYIASFDDIFDAFSEHFFGEDVGIMVVEREVSTKHINRFLREIDPKQAVKIVVAPRNTDWQVLTVNYRRQPYKTYVPITVLPMPDVAFVHRKQFCASATSREGAVALARQSMTEYLDWDNLPNRILRWWRNF